MCAAASVIMPRSFLIKKQNYSHCPLKKRPVVQVYREIPEIKDEAEDNSEPENLSTKPEDLIRTSSGVLHCCKTLTPPLGVTPISSASRATPANAPSPGATQGPPSAPGHPLPPPTPPPTSGAPIATMLPPSPTALAYPPGPYHTGAFTPVHYSKPVGGPLEPLNLNTAHAEHLHYWPRGPSALPSAFHHHAPAPPSYVPFGYHPASPYHHHHHPTTTPSYLTTPGHDQLSPYAPTGEPSPPPPPPPQAPNRPTYVPAAHPLVAALPHQPPRGLYVPFLATSASPELPEYYSRASPLLAPGHANPPPPVTPTDDGDENARPPVAAAVVECAPAPPSPPLSSSTVEDLSSPPSGPPSPSDAGGAKKAKAPSSRHQCPDCSKSYSTFSGLSKHRQFHCRGAGAGPQAPKKAKAGASGEVAAATFSCKHCDKTYVSLGALKMHIRTHTLPCECKLCGKAFSRPWLLQGHIRTHTGEKPFSCPHCCRAFADRSNLRAHLQTHSDVKKYSCPRCARTFSRMSLLAKHADGGCVGPASGPGGAPSTDAVKVKVENAGVAAQRPIEYYQ